MFSREWVKQYKEVGLSRKEHFIHAWSLIWNLTKMISALVIHSFAPRYYKNYYSSKQKELEDTWKR